MLKLISYMPNENSLEEFKIYKNKIENLNLEGIETVYGDYCSPEIFENLPIQGVHLIYFPTWLDIWLGNKERMLEDFSCDNPYGFSTKEDFIRCFKKQFCDALKLNPKYLVFHVSHVRPRDIFTFTYDYSNEDVLTASSELLNLVISEFFSENPNLDSYDLPYLLFENLPWPGLTFNNFQIELNFLNSIKYEKKGFMLDLSHLMCLNKNLDNYDDGLKFIENRLKRFLENPLTKSKIIGIHLNGSLSKKYLSQDFSTLLKKWESSNSLDRYHIEINHVKSIDTHSVFQSQKLQSFINKIDPKFLVYELSHKTLEDLLSKVEFQNSFLNSV